MPLYTGPTTKSYISSISFLDQREIMDELFDVTGEKATLVDIFELTGRVVPTDMPQYHTFTNDYIFKAGTISAIDATNNGEAQAGPVNETFVMTLSTQDELPIVGETALFRNKRQGWVSAVNESTRVVTVSPFSNAAADTISPAATPIVTSSKVTFFSGAYGEGSDAPSSRKPKFVRTANQVQIFKTYREITDLQKVSKVEVKFDGKPYVIYKVQNDVLFEHRAKMAYQFLVGKLANYTDGSGNAVTQTQGIRRHLLEGDGSVLTTGGVDIPLTAAVTLANIRTMSRSLDKRGAGKEFWMLNGGEFEADLDDELTSLGNLTQGGIVYNSWGEGDGKRKALDLGVSSFTIYGRTFHKKKLAAYDHPEVFAPESQFNYELESYLLPAGKVEVEGGGKTQEAIRCRYMAGDGTNFNPYLEVMTGALAPQPTSNKAVLGISYETIAGLEFIGVRQAGIFSRA